MAEALLLRCGPYLYWLGKGGPLAPAIRLAEGDAEAALVADRLFERRPAEVAAAVRARRPPGSVAVDEPGLEGFLEPGPRPIPLPERERLTLRRRLKPPSPREVREFYLALASRRLAQALAEPEEVLITLAREDERLERVVHREEGASVAFLAPPTGPLEEYRRSWGAVREGLRAHQERLLRELTEAAGRIAPHLTALLGARVTGRLVARAGGLAPLARMNSSRLQLLGSRRRPGPGRNPRFGVLFRAETMETVPPGRQGAYARSLAALAVIAARCDFAGGTDRRDLLRARRDRRWKSLRQEAP